MGNQHWIATDSSKPRGDIVWVLHAAAEQKQLRLPRRERQGQLVMHAANRIGDHLVFVDDEQLWAVAPEKTSALRLKRGDQNFRVEIQRQIASRDADIPPARAPFRELVVG